MKKLTRTISILFKTLLTIFTIGISLLSISLLFIPLSETSTSNFFSILSLAAPAVLLLNIIMLLLWTILYSGMAFLPLVALLLSLGISCRYFQFPFFQEYNNTKGFKAMTYNVHLFRDKQWRPSSDTIATIISAENPDILCIQEYENTNPDQETRFAEQIHPLKYFHKFTFSNSSKEGTGKGLAIFSKYPIVNKGAIDFTTGTYGAIYADVLLTKTDTIRVFNCHLQTTNINDTERILFSYDSLFIAKTRLNQYLDIAHKIHNNNHIRQRQADTIAQTINTSPYPVILCGDFNDVAASYTYSIMRDNRKDAFVSCGRGYGYTFNDLYSLLRIDYILYDPSFQCNSYHSPHIETSDHNPVIARFELFR